MKYRSKTIAKNFAKVALSPLQLPKVKGGCCNGGNDNPPPSTGSNTQSSGG